MVKILNLCKSLFIFSFFFSSVAFNELRSEEFFGYETYEPFTKYFSSKILSKKYEHTETLQEFYTVDITDDLLRREKSPFFDDYRISIDNLNIIHSIVLRRQYKNMDICQAISNTLVKKLTKKYNMTFSNADSTYPNFQRQSRVAKTIDQHLIGINCNYYFDSNTVEMWSFILTPEINKAVSEFYNKGFK